MSERKEVTLHAKNLLALRHLIHETPLDLDCGGPRRQDGGGVTITAFVTADDINSINRARDVDVIDLRDVGPARGADVGVGDRFKGGSLFPKGFARKLKEGSLS